MKRLYFILTFAVLLTLSSCENFMDVHQEYIKDGEIIYSPKVAATSFIAGNERILFLAALYKSPNVRSIDVFWNGRADSLIAPVTPTTEIDIFEIMIPNLPERSYTFDIRTTDIFGHKSLWSTDFGNSYGANYLNTLGNRRLNEVSMVEINGAPGGRVTFYSAADLLVRNEVRYTKSDGSTAIVTLPADLSEIECPDAKGGSTIDYRSFYIPEEEAIDTFATDWATSTSTFPFIYLYDRSNWEVLACSDERADDGGGMHMILDGDVNTYWHSQWGPDVDLPHWLLVDFGKPLNTVKIDLYRRPGNTDTKTVEIYFGDTPDAEEGEWTKVAETEVNANLMEVIPFDQTTKGRYMKIIFPDGNRPPYTNLSEIYLYGGT